MEKVQSRVVTPPPQPRELPSRISALPSRAPNIFQSLKNAYLRPERELSQTLADASHELLRSHGDYPAFLAATQAELLDTTFLIPSERPFQESDSRNIIAIGSGNTIKERELRDKLKPHRSVIERVAEAEESHTLNIVEDALSKAVDAARYINEGSTLRRRVIRTREFVTIATDVLNAVPVLQIDKETGNKKLDYQRLGKPSNLKHEDGTPYTRDEQIESVHQTFQNMAELAKTLDGKPISYLTEMATVIHNPQNLTANAVSTQRSAIFLSPEKLSYLATPEGFAEYQKKIADLGFDITKIAGGLELDVLDAMGIVSFITGTADDIQNKQFQPQREAAKNHAYSIALGHADERLITAYFEQGEVTNEQAKN